MYQNKTAIDLHHPYLSETNLSFINVRQITGQDLEIMDRLDITNPEDYDQNHSLIFQAETDDFLTYVDLEPKYITTYKLIFAVGFDLGPERLEPKLKSVHSKSSYFFPDYFSKIIPTTNPDLSDKLTFFNGGVEIENRLKKEYTKYLYHYKIFHPTSILDVIKIDVEITSDPEIRDRVIQILKEDLIIANELEKNVEDKKNELTNTFKNLLTKKEKAERKRDDFLKSRCGSIEKLKTLIENMKELEKKSDDKSDDKLETQTNKTENNSICTARDEIKNMLSEKNVKQNSILFNLLDVISGEINNVELTNDNLLKNILEVAKSSSKEVNTDCINNSDLENEIDIVINMIEEELKKN